MKFIFLFRLENDFKYFLTGVSIDSALATYYGTFGIKSDQTGENLQ